MTTKDQAIEKVLKRLRGAIGTGETPANSNHNFITEWYNDNVEKIGNGPWCEMTNTWAKWTGGAKVIKTGRAYTVYATQDAIHGANGSTWHYGTKGMRKGDEVYYDWSGKKGNAKLVDHTGTVERILGDGTFYVLEGNTSNNTLRRMRRDSKFVVGYARLDWEQLVSHVVEPPTPTKPVKRPTPDRALTKRIQHTLEVPTTGEWGKTTDYRAQRMRTAARAKAGYPKHVKKGFNVKDVQLIIDTAVDGDWGPKSQAALVHWIKQFQSAVHMTVDGQWGPKTDNAYLAARKHNHNNF